MRVKKEYPRSRPYGKWQVVARQLAANLVGQGVRAAGNYVATKVKTKFAKKAVGVTSQHDVVNQYKKSFMPKGKKKAWRKFTRKVTAAVDQHLGTRSIVRNYTYLGTLAPATQQGYVDFGLYTLGDGWTAATGGVGDLYRDIQQIGVAVGLGDPTTVTAGTSTNSVRKMEFRSAVLDFTFKNQSPGNGLEIDLYVVRPKKVVRQSGNATLATIMDNGWLATGTPAGGTNLTTMTRGVTPWQSTALCRRFTIMSKKKYFIPAGNTFTYQYRDPRNYVVDTNRFGQSGLSFYGLPHMNVMILLCVKRIVGESNSTGHDFAIGITRTYTMKRWDDADEDLFV